MVPVLDILAAGTVVCAVAALVVRVVTSRKKKVMPTVFAQGLLHVTGEGEVVIDEVLPANKALLQDPESYITVQFDPNQPRHRHVLAVCPMRWIGSCSSLTFTVPGCFPASHVSS